jgi:predicted dinucleotide-binding enzyme
MSSLILPEVNAARFLGPANGSPLPHPFDGAAQTTLLHRMAGIRDSDHVVVIGRRTLDHLIALNRRNCRSVTAIHPDRSFPCIDKADVIWVASGVKADRNLLPLIQNAQGLRTVIIELTGMDAGSRLPLLLEDLRFEGFVNVVSQGVPDGKVVMAFRPDWLRRII